MDGVSVCTYRGVWTVHVKKQAILVHTREGNEVLDTRSTVSRGVQGTGPG